MPSRTIAIGDVHGCARALEALLEVVKPRPEDVIVTLGDYVNRGPDTRGVLDRLIALERQCTLIPLLGNHDQTLLEAHAVALSDDAPGRPRAASDLTVVSDWIRMGGDATLLSYGAARGRLTAADLVRIPPAHCEFLERCRDYYETDTHIFVHAQYDPGTTMDEQFPHDLRWESLKTTTPGPHISRKKVVVGHSAQKTGEIRDLGHLVCIDTFCYGGGWLTALDVHTEEIWQTNKQGQLRSPGSP
jgi:serine/threonine protein phosphatase 1